MILISGGSPSQGLPGWWQEDLLPLLRQGTHCHGLPKQPERARQVVLRWNFNLLNRFIGSGPGREMLAMRSRVRKSLKIWRICKEGAASGTFMLLKSQLVVWSLSFWSKYPDQGLLIKQLFRICRNILPPMNVVLIVPNNVVVFAEKKRDDGPCAWVACLVPRPPGADATYFVWAWEAGPGSQSDTEGSIFQGASCPFLPLTSKYRSRLLTSCISLRWNMPIQDSHMT